MFGAIDYVVVAHQEIGDTQQLRVGKFARDLLSSRRIGLCPCGYQQHVADEIQQIAKEQLEIAAALRRFVERFNDAGVIAFANERQKACEEIRIREAEDGGHVGGGEAAPAEGDDLIEDRQSVAHASLAAAGDDFQRRIVRFDLLGLADLAEPCHQLLDRDLAQGELLHARQDRRRHLLHLGGGKHEDDVRRRLFDEFQQRVPRRCGEHVRLVDDEDAKAVARRLELRDIPQLANAVDAGVGRGIDLTHVEIDPLGDLAADRALVVRLRCRAFHAIERLRQDPRHGRLTHAAHAGKEIRVMNAALFDRVLQRSNDGLLADDVAEALRAVFASESLIGHSGRV